MNKQRGGAMNTNIRNRVIAEVRKNREVFLQVAREREVSASQVEAMDANTLTSYFLSKVPSSEVYFQELVVERVEDDQDRCELVAFEIAEIIRENSARSDMLADWQKAERKEEEKQALYARLREEAIIQSMWVHAHA